MDHLPSDEEIADRIADLLDDGGARTHAEIAAAIGLGPDGPAIVQEVIDADLLPLVMPLPDGREVSLLPLLNGRVLTHRLTAEEVAGRHLDLTVDLAPFGLLGEELDRTTSGVTFTDTEEGWLFTGPLWSHLGARAGDLLAVSLVDEEIAIERLDDVAPDPTAAEPIVAAVAALGGRPGDLAELVWGICAADPEAFTRPGLPLGDLVEAAGLSRHDALVGPAGLDIAAFSEEQAIRRLVADYDLEPEEAASVLLLSGLVLAAGRATAEIAADQGALTEALADLAEPVVASALVEETVVLGWREPEALQRLTASWVETAPRAARSNLWWVRAHALMRGAATLEAEQALEQALDLDGDNPLALVDLARFSADRGDLDRSLSLLRRAGIEEDSPTVQLLVSLQTPPVEVGRNDPCWCGSGRKFKVCHLRGGDLAPEARATWLYEKAAAFLPESRWWERAHDLALLACETDDPEHLAEHENDDLVVDALLAEDGAFAAFVEQRGVLMPPEDLALAQAWLDVRRDLHVVVGVADDVFACVPYRDLPRAPDAVTVIWPGAGEALSMDDVIVARLLPVGTGFMSPGGVAVVPSERVHDVLALLQARSSADDVVELLSEGR